MGCRERELGISISDWNVITACKFQNRRGEKGEYRIHADELW